MCQHVDEIKVATTAGVEAGRTGAASGLGLSAGDWSFAPQLVPQLLLV